MSSDTKMRSFVSGLSIGMFGMCLSGLSNAVCKTKLGYEQIGVVNLIEVGVLTGISSSLFLFVNENARNWISQIPFPK